MATAVAKRTKYQNPRATYGSVAYDLDYAETVAHPSRGGAEVLQPRPLVKTREHAVARPRVRVREAGKISLFAVTGFLAVGVFAVLLLMSSIQMTSLSDDIAGLNRQMSTLQSEETKLRTQYELAFDLTEIEAKMTQTGAMVKPQSGQVLYLDLSEPDSVVLFEDPQTPLAGAESIFNAVKQVFENMVEYFR
ncbi:MAG: hypothetical protein RR403_05100 [Pseudoflavonifractor sp.]